MEKDEATNKNKDIFREFFKKNIALPNKPKKLQENLLHPAEELDRGLETIRQSEESEEGSISSDEEINYLTPSQKLKILGYKQIRDSFPQQSQVVFSYIKKKSQNLQKKSEIENLVKIKDTLYHDMLIRQFKTDNALCIYLKKVSYRDIEDKFISIKNVIKEEGVKDYFFCVQIEKPGHVSVVVFNVKNYKLEEIKLFTTYFLLAEEVQIIDKISSSLLELKFLSQEDKKEIQNIALALRNKSISKDEAKKERYKMYNILEKNPVKFKKHLIFFKNNHILEKKGACSISSFTVLKNIEEISRKEGEAGLNNFFNTEDKNQDIEDRLGETLKEFNSMKNLGIIEDEMIWYLKQNKGYSHSAFKNFIQKDHKEISDLIEIDFKDEKMTGNFSNFIRDFTRYAINVTGSENGEIDGVKVLQNYLYQIEDYKNLNEEDQEILFKAIIANFPSQEKIDKFESESYKKDNYERLSRIFKENRKKRKGSQEYKNQEDEVSSAGSKSLSEKSVKSEKSIKVKGEEINRDPVIENQPLDKKENSEKIIVTEGPKDKKEESAEIVLSEESSGSKDKNKPIIEEEVIFLENSSDSKDKKEESVEIIVSEESKDKKEDPVEGIPSPEASNDKNKKKEGAEREVVSPEGIKIKKGKAVKISENQKDAEPHSRLELMSNERPGERTIYSASQENIAENKCPCCSII